MHSSIVLGTGVLVKSVTVYRALDKIQVLTAQDTLTGESVIPGFQCQVADFFVGLK